MLSMDVDKIVPVKSLTIREGAILPWQNYFSKTAAPNGSWGYSRLKAMESQWGIDFDKPWKALPKKHRDLILKGSNGREMKVNWTSQKIQGQFTTTYEGILNSMWRRYQQTKSESMKKWYARFLSSKTCPTCQGKRLKPEVLSIRIGGKSIIDITSMTIGGAYAFLDQLALDGNRQIIAEELVKEIKSRLGFLINVGLDYLSMSRKGPTLSGGESQRIRLASQIGSELTGVLYLSLIHI